MKGKGASFLICGAQKSGTTALADYLRLHKKVYIPKQKELHFFDDERVDWNCPDYGRYNKAFSGRSYGQVCGEATPIYMYWNASPERIWKYRKNMRLVVVLRNPVDRAYSHWNMERSRGNETRRFEEAIQNELERLEERIGSQDRIRSYVDRGFYSWQIRRLWTIFGREAVLVIKQEDLYTDTKKTLNRVFEHIGVPKMEIGVSIMSHKGCYDEKMSLEARKLLLDVYVGEVLYLQEMLGWDCSSWIDGFDID